MSNSLQKEQWANEARLLYFKHREDLVKVLEDLRAKYEDEVDNVGERITLDFVKKVIKKFKRQEKANDPFVASYIMRYVYMGAKQREVDWQIDDQELEEYKFSYRSVCCDKATDLRTNKSNGEEYFICLKCGERCQVYRAPNLDIFEVKRRIRIEKRKDEEHLVKAIDTLGFGGEKPPIIKQNNYQVFTGDNSRNRKRVKNIAVEDQKLIENTEDMDSRDRETVIKQVEKMKKDMTTDEQEG